MCIRDSADAEKIKQEIEEIIGLDTSNAINCSAKTGEGIEDILEAVVSRIPHPKDEVKSPTKALIFDSYYDPYRGVIAVSYTHLRAHETVLDLVCRLLLYISFLQPVI